MRDYPLDSDFNDPMPEDTVTQTVSIFGPNLSGLGQRKGTFHVHTTDCRDCGHYGPRGKYGGERSGWDVTADSIAAIVMDIYADVMTDDPEQASANWDVYVNDIWFAPCVTLPNGKPFDGDDPIHWGAANAAADMAALVEPDSARYVTDPPPADVMPTVIITKLDGTTITHKAGDGGDLDTTWNTDRDAFIRLVDMLFGLSDAGLCGPISVIPA